MSATLVIQSYRTNDIPQWIRQSLDSVEAWATGQGYDYEFIGDEFFTFAPQWFRDRCEQHFYPVTDIARLYLLQNRLAQGYEQAIWIDADVIVFDPAQFIVTTRSGYAFSHEVMLGLRQGGGWELSAWSINNAVMIFKRNHPMLAYYIFAAEEIIRNTPVQEFTRTMIGPLFLNALSRVMPIERLTCVGLFTPEYINILANQTDPKLLAAYRKHFSFPMAAANLCHFVRSGAAGEEVRALDRLFDRAIDLLMISQGAIVNNPELPLQKPVRQQIFRQIYLNNIWGRSENLAPYSGIGSEARFADPYVQTVATWLQGKNFRTVVDLGCGNFSIGSAVAQRHPQINFIGVDIVDHVIKHVQQTFVDLANVRFQIGDILLDELPPGDVCLIRQVLQHYDNNSVKLILERISKIYRFCIITEHIRISPDLLPNLDKPVNQHIRDGAGLQINLPPFDVPATVLLDVPYAEYEILRTFLVKFAIE